VVQTQRFICRLICRDLAGSRCYESTIEPTIKSISSVRRTLSGHERKSGDVSGEEFAAQARRERRAYPSGVCKERATPPGPQRTAARRGAPHLAWRFVARRSQPHRPG